MGIEIDIANLVELGEIFNASSLRVRVAKEKEVPVEEVKIAPILDAICVFCESGRAKWVLTSEKNVMSQLGIDPDEFSSQLEIEDEIEKRKTILAAEGIAVEGWRRVDLEK
ncbi:hypothetical protein KKD37_00330 [Patescibacteria group bacterium]|nr:hypothetical protein [Patescibacteria group bacterium]